MQWLLCLDKCINKRILVDSLSYVIKLSMIDGNLIFSMFSQRAIALDPSSKILHGDLNESILFFSGVLIASINIYDFSFYARRAKKSWITHW